MLVQYIMFEDGLDIKPLENEEFRYEIGEGFIYHWENGELLAAYNTRFIREIVFIKRGRNELGESTEDNEPSILSEIDTKSRTDVSHKSEVHPKRSIMVLNDTNNDTIEQQHNSIPICEEPVEEIQPEGIEGYSPKINDYMPKSGKLIHMLCSCDPNPNPNCPVCRRDYLDH